MAAVCYHVWREYSSPDKFQETLNVEKLYGENKRSNKLPSVKFSNKVCFIIIFLTRYTIFYGRGEIISSD